MGVLSLYFLWSTSDVVFLHDHLRLDSTQSNLKNFLTVWKPTSSISSVCLVGNSSAIQIPRNLFKTILLYSQGIQRVLIVDGRTTLRAKSISWLNLGLNCRKKKTKKTVAYKEIQRVEELTCMTFKWRSTIYNSSDSSIIQTNIRRAAAVKLPTEGALWASELPGSCDCAASFRLLNTSLCWHKVIII